MTTYKNKKMHLKITLNRKSGLYVLAYSPVLQSGKLGTRGAFVTCHGFEVVRSNVEAVSVWLKANGRAEAVEKLEKRTPKNPSVGYYRFYLALMKEGAKLNKETGLKCEKDLTPSLIGLEGKTVEAVYSDGEKKRFKVGRSTGWMPIHLEISVNPRATGGPAVYDSWQSLRVV